MRYKLYISSPVQQLNLEITEDQFHALEEAKEFLHFVVTHEESYDILVSNYLEFEQEILQLTLQNMMYSDYSTDGFYELRMRLNKRLVNLLTSVKLYQDLSRHLIPENFNDRKKYQNDIKCLFSKEYDNKVYYRFMEELRRYTQHAGLAVHLTSVSRRRVDPPNSNHREYSVNFSSYSNTLKKDKMFNAAKFPELDDEIDLKIAVRHYIESLSAVHISIREIFKKNTLDSREIIKSAHIKFNEEFDCNTQYLRAASIDKDSIEEDIAILLDWDDVRIKLQQKNKSLTRLSDSYITSISKEKKN
ncbi:hypothetical protein [Draconibacterium sediminis]|uniref:hypothetical protein n=1 Tax=Draconibacterium sediminis TaxID=1544798 RepID=UPI0026F30913|nr:hypothetical protein [Draconibacterium sediminis]